jgi:hypothetical protein
MIISFICRLCLSIRSFGIGSRTRRDDYGLRRKSGALSRLFSKRSQHPMQVGELPIPKKPLTVLAVTLAESVKLTTERGQRYGRILQTLLPHRGCMHVRTQQAQGSDCNRKEFSRWSSRPKDD